MLLIFDVIATIVLIISKFFNSLALVIIPDFESFDSALLIFSIACSYEIELIKLKMLSLILSFSKRFNDMFDYVVFDGEEEFEADCLISYDGYDLNIF